VSLHLYAVCAAPPPSLGRRRGAAGESLRAVRVGSLVAVVGDVAAPPALDRATLRAHDATVRALARSVSALLPVRFGTMASDESHVAAMVGERRDVLAKALDLVAGREQMTLRVFGDTSPRGSGTRVRTRARGTGAGTGYLAARRAAERAARAVPEIAWLRPALRRFVKAERVERHRTPPLVATVHHLIPRGDARAYVAAVRRAGGRDGRPVRVVAQGPSPPWAFAREP
jgi:hypothetical protein